MSPEQPNAYFDLNRAKALSKRLKNGTATSEAPKSIAPQNDYVSLGSSIIPATAAAPASSPMGMIPETSAPVIQLGEAPWNVMLKHATDIVGARGGFVIDTHGFVVVEEGDMGGLELNEIGARLAVIEQQATQLPNKRQLGAIAVEHESGWFITLPFSVGAYETTLVLLSAQPPGAGKTDALRELLAGFVPKGA